MVASPDEFVAYSSRWKTAALVLVSLGFVGVGLWMTGAFGSAPTWDRFPKVLIQVIGWASIGFFALCAVGWGTRLLDRQPQLWIGPGGIRSAQWSEETIPWSEITDVTTWAFRGQETIVLHLRDATRFPGRGMAAMLANANRGLTGGDISISLTGTDGKVEDALSAIHRFRSGLGSVDLNR